MATPNYVGEGQPSDSGGFLGRWFGSIFGVSPAYVSAPKDTLTSTTSARETTSDGMSPSCPIAIVIPRGP